MNAAHGGQSFQKNAIPILIVFSLGLASLLWLKAVGNGVVGATNFGAFPTPAVFQRVTGAKPPAGISNLRVSGHSFVIKQWVWMTGSLSDQAWLNFIKGQQPIDKEELGLVTAQNYCANTYFETADKSAVGWQSPLVLHPKEVFRVANYDDDINWTGYLFRDPKSHIFYIHAGD